MWKRFLHFVQYNNAFVLIVALFFSSTAATFAASPAAREAMYTETQTVISVDNTYLLSVDLDAYDFQARVLTVEEDDEKYYVTYSYKTIEIEDYVWRDVVKDGEPMTFSKQSLLGKDLGLAVADELKQLVDSQRLALKETQNRERLAGVSQKVVTTEYSGLIGQLLSPDSKEFPGYTPVVDESLLVEESVSEQVASVIANGGVAAIVDSFQKNVANADNPIPGYPVITLLGNNPAIIEVGSSYSDLGGTIEDDKDKNLGLSMAGEWIDTSKPGEHYVRYSVTDNDGNTTTGRRLVRVVEPGAIASEPAEDPAPASDPAPEPVASEPVVVEPTETATTTQPDPKPVTPAVEPVATSTEPAPPVEPLPQETAVEPAPSVPESAVDVPQATTTEQTPPAPAPEPEPAPTQTASSTENTNASSTSNHSNQ